MPNPLLYTTKGDQLVSLLEGPDSSLDIDENGKASASITYTVKRAFAMFAIMRVTRHPEFTMLVKKTVSVQFEEPDWAKVTIKFEGVVTPESEVEPGVVRRYSVQGTTGAEPIETHENFAEFGGKPKPGTEGPNEKGAVFDKDGTFKGFAVQDLDNGIDYYGSDDNENMAGVKSYLAPSVTYSEIRTYNGAARSELSMSLPNLGKIDTPPASPLLPDIGSRQWLLVSYDAEEQGDGVQVKKSWRASGPRGWNAQVYSGESIPTP
jgi:hypothetical protein